MMQKQWLLLRQALQGDDVSLSEIYEPFFARVLEVYSDSKAGTGDLLSAFFDALQCANAHSLNLPRLPGSKLIASPEQFDIAGLHKDPVLCEVSLSEKARRELSDIYAQTYRREQRRFLKKAPLDHALSELLKDSRYKEYNGLGQQTALRVALTSPNDSLIFINLPTGCGKTLVINGLMLSTPAERLTLVIVPTVGLAIEQGERAREALKIAGKDHGGAYAWYHKTNVNERLHEHGEIKKRMLSGEQQILFCSPESAKGSLLPTLFKLAKTGQIASIVIDEAHLVDQWGAEFRPEFQLLSPLIQSLQSESSRGLRKILMSATFNQATLETLKELFTSKNQIPIEVNGSFLRPEPSYSVQSTLDEADHKKAVLQAVRKLPRPLILYSTEVEDARYWYNLLSRQGFNRMGLFHGKTDERERRSLIQQWQEGKLDIMVATSAFGVGMDKSDVRSVLHIAVPENIDRFYQESGRGGRDGCACLSTMLYYSDQLDVAKELNKDKLITTELGLKRWSAMHATRQSGDDGRSYVSLNAKHPDINFHSKANRAWNWRTLLLMQRVGFIRLHFNTPKIPHIASDGVQGDALVQEYFDKYFSQIGITILRGDHLELSTWQQEIGAKRVRERQARDAGFSTLTKWLDKPSTPLCSLLEEFYTLDGYSPQIACGGCPGCYCLGHEEQRSESFVAFTPTLGEVVTVTGLRQETGLGSEILVHYDGRKKSFELLLHELRHRISHLIQSSQVEAIRALPQVHDALTKILPERGKFWCALEPSAENDIWDELVLVMPTEQVFHNMGYGSNSRIVIAPDHIKDPYNPGRTWCETDPRCISIEQFLRKK
ncbi:protein DpdF [Shewanella algae]|nr:protein DpdF [Shewanella algae]